MSGEQSCAGGGDAVLVVVLVTKVDVSVTKDTSEVVGGELGIPVTIHKQAEEMRDGDPEHCETKGGSPVVAV